MIFCLVRGTDYRQIDEQILRYLFFRGLEKNTKKGFLIFTRDSLMLRPNTGVFKSLTFFLDKCILIVWKPTSKKSGNSVDIEKSLCFSQNS